MSNIVMSINRKELSFTLGMDHIVSAFEKSGLFEMRTHNETINAMRGYRAFIMYLNDKKIYMDFWEYPTPTYTVEAMKANFDLIIKLQHKKMSQEYVEEVCARKGFFGGTTTEERKEFMSKIVPFTFFPSKMMNQYIGKEDQIPVVPIEKLGFFCGKSWKCRNGIQKKLESEKDIEYIVSDQRFNNIIPQEEYLKKMLRSKYGIVLHGRASHFTDAKNRREIDYMMMKKPLLLNYRPYYYDPLIEGKHYIYFDEKTDFNKLEEMYNIPEIVNNATQWYKDNASQEGIVKTFMQILADRKLI